MVHNRAQLRSVILGLILLFQLAFAIVLIFYYDIVVLEPRLKFVTREYYEWYMTTPPKISYEGDVINFVEAIMSVFGVSFALADVYFLCKNRKKLRVLCVFVCLNILAVVSIVGWFYYLNADVLHYRLFMRMIPCEILSLLILAILLLDRRAWYTVESC